MIDLAATSFPFSSSSISPMATNIFLSILLFVFPILWYKIIFSNHKNKNKNKPSSVLPRKWPFVGRLPGILLNISRFPDYMTEILILCGGTCRTKGPSFANMRYLVTSDPANINHILTKNFTNFSKGARFKVVMDVLGTYGFLNATGESWEAHRRYARLFLHQQSFQRFLFHTTCEKIKNGLIPVLDNLQHGEVDFQDIFDRFTFDSTCIAVLGHDPATLCVGLPNHPCEKAFNHIMEGMFYRQFLPEAIWKVQRWLNIGREQKVTIAWNNLTQFLSECISSKHEALSSSTTIKHKHDDKEEEEEDSSCSGIDILTSFINVLEQVKTDAQYSNVDSNTFLSDTMWNFLIAGKDTLSSALTWFFYLLAKHPSEQSIMLQEIITIMHATTTTSTEDEQNVDNSASSSTCGLIPDPEKVKKLIYLRGAISEALRLFPPIAFEYRDPVEADILPTGHRVDMNTHIILSFYSMGRMKSVWGEDCLEFKPARWITDKGKIKHEPAFKFCAFHAGPRSCLGKEISFLQMQMISASIIYMYKVELVEDHPICPTDSFMLRMRYGLKVRLTRRFG